MNEDIYTPIEIAAVEIKKRWNDKELQKKVDEYLGGDIPEIFSKEPRIVLFRNISTANCETDRLLELSKKIKMNFAFIEYNSDKFVAFNPDKYALLMEQINAEKKNDGHDVLYKIKIADIQTVQGKPFKDIKTRWGENLVDFHHNILLKCHPECEGKIFDLSEWIKNHGGRARFYYEKFMALLLRNCILAESFQTKGDEGKFVSEIIAPAFANIKNIFGIRPLIIQLAPDGKAADPVWWCPKKEMRSLIKNYIKEHQ